MCVTGIRTSSQIFESNKVIESVEDEEEFDYYDYYDNYQDVDEAPRQQAPPQPQVKENEYREVSMCEMSIKVNNKDDFDSI